MNLIRMNCKLKKRNKIFKVKIKVARKVVNHQRLKKKLSLKNRKYKRFQKKTNLFYIKKKKKNIAIMKKNGNMEIQILRLLFLVSATQT